MRLDQLRINGEIRNSAVFLSWSRKRKRKKEREEREGEGRERNPLSAINRIKDDFPRLEEMSRENSSNRVESSRWRGTMAGLISLIEML